MLINRAGDQHAAGLADALQARCDIDPLAKDVVAFDQHVADRVQLGRRIEDAAIANQQRTH